MMGTKLGFPFLNENIPTGHRVRAQFRLQCCVLQDIIETRVQIDLVLTMQGFF